RLPAGHGWEEGYLIAIEPALSCRQAKTIRTRERKAENTLFFESLTRYPTFHLTCRPVGIILFPL
ncbi:MAG: hypothetical protein WCP19_09500, partial [Chloroflexota bacterium]